MTLGSGPMIRPMRTASRTVVVLAYDGVQLLDVAGPVEVFEAATALGGGYRIVIASPGGEDVIASGRVRLGADRAFAQLPRRIDTLVVPGAPSAPELPADDVLVGAVRRAAGRSRRVASVCAGAFLLAAAGLLDGRRATTHWASCRALAERHPRIEVEPDPIFVRDGDVWTSAGVTAGLDLALALVEEDLGRRAALEVARWL